MVCCPWALRGALLAYFKRKNLSKYAYSAISHLITEVLKNRVGEILTHRISTFIHIFSQADYALIS